MKKIIVFGFSLLLGTFLRAQKNETRLFDSLGIVQVGAIPELISSQFAFTEGPVADKKGNVFFTDQPNNVIWRYGLDGALTIFKKEAGRANGLDIDKNGNIVACADANNELWLISPKGETKTILGKVNGELLNGPNDVWLDSKGGMYFTDPYYQRDYWVRTQPAIKPKVYFLPKNATQPIAVSDALKQPNGIVGTPDGKHLFVADIGDNKTYKFDIDGDGHLSNRRLFVARGADGIDLDERGNLYLAGNGVTVFDTAGTKIAYIPIPENWTANLCFGGKARNILFMTAGKSIYALRMNVKGFDKFAPKKKYRQSVKY